MSSSDKTVYVAMGANLVISVAKFVASAFTGSTSMLAEGVHSAVDTGSNGLLLVGSRAQRRPPDEMHPFGYGKEQYFWTLIVAMLLFALGGGISVLEGISGLRDPRPIDQPAWNYGVLVVSLIMDGYSWAVAFRQLRMNRDEPILRAARASKDPSNFAIWFEDSAAIVGVVFAFVGVLLSQWLDSSYPDGVASMLIGLTMAGTAILLAYETKKLLIGESADPEMIAGISKIVEADEDVAVCGPPLTMHLGPEDILLNVDVQFREELRAGAIIESVDRLEDRIRSEFKAVRRIFIEPKRLRNDDGQSVESPYVGAGQADSRARPDRRTPADY